MNPRGAANVERPEPIRALRRSASVLPVAAAGAAIALTSLVASGCFFSESGLSPATNAFYYPTGLAVSPGRTAMYVANSDFDLQYNGGTVQALDLVTLRKELATMLAGIRCSEGISSECHAPFTTWGAPCGDSAPCADGLTCSATFTCGVLRDVCNQLPGDPSGGVSTAANGATCSLPADCASGVCTNGVCIACKQDADCPGGTDMSCPGKCGGGTCQLTCVSNNYLTPSACSPIAPPYLPGGTATIGAFASGAVIAQDPAGSATARLFVPVRGDPSITWFDIPDDTSASPSSKPLDCGQTNGGHCSDDHRVGVDPYDNFRDETLPVEPVGLDISEDGVDIVTAHQIPNGPAVGLSINDWDAKRATFSFALTQDVAAGPSNVAHIPQPKLVKVAAVQAAAGTLPTPLNYQQGFLVTYNGAAEVDTFRVNPDPTSSPPRPYLTRALSSPITVNQTGTDSRGIVVDSTDRSACEAACPAPAQTLPSVSEYDACLASCTNTPLRVFLANRTPPSLLLGQISTTVTAGDSGDIVSDALEIYENVAPLPQGPSNVAFGQVIAPDGSLQTMVFIVSFDTRRVNIYDPVTQTVLSPPVVTGRGPQAIAFDACSATGQPGKPACGEGEVPHAYLYVGHFTDSYIGVVDLDRSHPETFGTMFASVGVPIEPVETQ